MPVKNTCALLLAGEEREKSGNPRSGALSQLLFRPLIRWVWDNCTEAGIGDICVIAGEDPERIQRELPEGAPTVRREAGQGLRCAEAFLTEHRDKDVLVITGDAPFLFPHILEGALAAHREKGSAATTIAAVWKNPMAGEEQLYTTRCGWFRGEKLLALLEKGTGANELAGALQEAGEQADCWLSPDFRAALRGTGRQQLALLSHLALEMTLDRLYEQGVDIAIPDGVVIDPRAKIGEGSQILPGTIIKGETVVGKNSVIGPNSWLEDSVLGEGCVINATYVLGSVLEEDVQLGPFVRVRPGSRLGAGVRIGNFVEVKNATVGPGTKSAHLTYIGDADVGARVNFGCGVCIANYDGVQKHRTTIGDDCFLGCNTNLVAPVVLGAGAYTAAGTTVTEDVPEDALCIGRSRQVNLPERAKEHQKHPRK